MDFKTLGLMIDHIGFLVWIFLGTVALYDLKKGLGIKWQKKIFIIISICGIFLDGILLLSFYLNWKLASFALMFDILGIPVFTFIIYVAISELRNKNLNKNLLYKLSLLLVGVSGLLVDGFILFGYYFLQ